MKKTTLIILILLAGVISKSFGQKIEENKTDDFTGKTVKRTSWESLFSSSDGIAHFRISEVGSDEIIDLKLMLGGKVFSIEKDGEMMLKLDDGEVITLANYQSAISSKGAGATGMNGSGAEGVQVTYPMTKDQVSLLKAHKVVKVRIVYTDGALDSDVSDKNGTKIQACFNLL